jgi:hypothetical protein
VDPDVNAEDDGVEGRNDGSTYMLVNNPHQSSGGVGGDIGIGVNVYDNEGMIERHFAPQDQLGTFCNFIYMLVIKSEHLLFLFFCCGPFHCRCTPITYKLLQFAKCKNSNSNSHKHQFFSGPPIF